MASVMCPRDQTEWKDRSKHCVSNEQSYHCLPDEYGNLVNACVDPVWIQPGNCPVFRSEENLVESVVCQPAVGTCPDVVYLSNQVLQYPVCTMSTQKSTTPIVFTVTMRNQSTTPAPTLSEDSTSCGAACVGAAVAVPIVVLLLVVVIVVFVLRRRSASRGGSKKGMPSILQRFQKNQKQDDIHIHLENEEQGKKLLDGKQKEADMVKPDDLNPFADDMNDEENEEGSPWDSFLKALNLKVEHLYKPPSAENLGTRLRSLEVMSVVGRWGSGRTTLVKQTILECALKFSNSICKFTTVDSILDWEKGVHADCTCFIYVPDCIKEWYRTSYVEDVVECCREMTDNARGKCFIMLDVLENIWIEYQHILSQCEPFEGNRLHFMQSTDILSSNDYKEIVQRQMSIQSRNDSPASFQARLLAVKANTPIGLPELIALSCKNTGIFSNFQKFCAEPLAVIKDDLKQMAESPKTTEKHRFVVLTYAMIHNGSFCLNKLNKGLLRSIRTIFAVFSPPDDYFEEATTSLMDDYLELSADKETHYIQHDIITRVIFEIVAESKIEFLIQHCDSKLLLNCVRPAAFSFTSIFGKLNKELVVGIDAGQHQALRERFKQLENGGESEVRKHVIMEDAGFQRLMMS